jgi:hypothetical protein
MAVMVGIVVGTGVGIPRAKVSSDPRLLILSEAGLYIHSVELTLRGLFAPGDSISDFMK